MNNRSHLLKFIFKFIGEYATGWEKIFFFLKFKKKRSSKILQRACLIFPNKHTKNSLVWTSEQKMFSKISNLCDNEN